MDLLNDTRESMNPQSSIGVTEVSDRPSDHVASGSLDGLVTAYLHLGREEGYQRAINEMLASIVPIAERFLRQHPESSPELRKFVYAFGQSVEEHLNNSRTTLYVDGGLGI